MASASSSVQASTAAGPADIAAGPAEVAKEVVNKEFVKVLLELLVSKLRSA